MNSRKIPKWLLWTSWLRMMFFQMTSQSFDRGYTNAFTGAMSPILRYLYKEHPDADQRIREGLNRTRNYYLCEQSFSGVAFAIIVGMEERLANGEPISGEMIAATRSSIIGPMSGLGDTIHGSTTRQLAVALTIPFCLLGNWKAAFLMLIFLNISPFAVAFLGVPKGYQEGSSFVLKLVKSGLIQKIAPVVSSAYMFLFGTIASRFLTQNLKDISVKLPVNSYLLAFITGILIYLYNVMLAKKIKPNWLVLGSLIIGTLLAFFA